MPKTDKTGMNVIMITDKFIKLMIEECRYTV
jgi:hypothetical protein